MRVKLNLDRITTQSLQTTLYFGFTNIRNQENFSDSWQDVTLLSFTRQYLSLTCGVIQNGITFTLNENTLLFLSATHDYVIFDCDLDTYAKNNIDKLLSLGYIELDIEGFTSIILYKQNSANNVVNKSLTLVDIIQGKFNIPIALKTFTLDLDGNYVFNYIWIPLLNRYYYVNSIQKYTDTFTRYTFGEDVLMTWQTLIRNQNAFVTRQAGATNLDLVDNRYPLNDIYSEDNLVGFMEDTASAKSKVNCSLNFSIDPTLIGNFIYLATTKEKHGTPAVATRNVYNSPSSSLPAPEMHVSAQTHFYFLDGQSVAELLFACLGDSATASYLDGILWLPFDPEDTFNLLVRESNNTTKRDAFYIGAKVLKNDGTFVNYTSTLTYNDRVDCAGYTKDNKKIMSAPYFVIKDFTITHINSDWRDYEPYTNYEIFIPFCQWVKVNSLDIFSNNSSSDRLLIYYSMDMSTGQATAYLYNYTRGFIIWSGGCQLGIKLDITASNATENLKAKQSADLNMILGLVSSAVSIGIGVVSENPIAIVGGVLSASNTIASNVNTNRMLLNRASSSLGSNDGALYATDYVDCRITRYLPVLTSDEETIFYATNGKPYNKYTSLSSLSGYTEIGKIYFNPSNYAISQDEINEIVAILRDGVIL